MVSKGRYYIVSREHLGECGHSEGSLEREQAEALYADTLNDGQECVILFAVEVPKILGPTPKLEQ